MSKPDVKPISEYYFTPNLDVLKGLRPGSRDVLTIDGPFLGFNYKTRILRTRTEAFLLPEDQVETSSKLKDHTLTQLYRLAKA